ncbi:MAG: hypothetical protein ACI97A_002765 [Planctomycetota bacterium]|jgi:hypothetical protein
MAPRDAQCAKNAGGTPALPVGLPRPIGLPDWLATPHWTPSWLATPRWTPRLACHAPLDSQIGLPRPIGLPVHGKPKDQPEGGCPLRVPRVSRPLINSRPKQKKTIRSLRFFASKASRTWLRILGHTKCEECRRDAGLGRGRFRSPRAHHVNRNEERPKTGH